MPLLCHIDLLIVIQQLETPQKRNRKRKGKKSGGPGSISTMTCIMAKFIICSLRTYKQQYLDKSWSLIILKLLIKLRSDMISNKSPSYCLDHNTHRNYYVNLTFPDHQFDMFWF